MPRYFPACAPDPDPAEGQWRNTGLRTASRLYGSADGMKEPIGTMLRTGEITVAKMGDYLM